MEKRKNSSSSATRTREPWAAQRELPPVRPPPPCVVPLRDCLSQMWVSDASGESDPEMSTLLLAAADGNQVSCLIRALSDVAFIPPRDAEAPGGAVGHMLTLKRLFATSPSGAEITVESCILTALSSRDRKNIFEDQGRDTWGPGGRFLVAVVNYIEDPECQICLSAFPPLLSNAQKINLGIRLIIYVSAVRQEKAREKEGESVCVLCTAWFRGIQPNIPGRLAFGTSSFKCSLQNTYF